MEERTSALRPAGPLLLHVRRRGRTADAVHSTLDGLVPAAERGHEHQFEINSVGISLPTTDTHRRRKNLR